jgi:hypothetical protein
MRAPLLYRLEAVTGPGVAIRTTRQPDTLQTVQA